MWLDKRNVGLSLESGCSNEVVFASANGKVNGLRVTVKVNSRLAYERRLAIMLHECGHVAIYKARRRAPNRRVHGCNCREWWNNRGRLKQGTKKRKLSTLDEEIAAWEIGEKLGRKLGIRVARETFERCRVKCLLTYVRNI